ncbi:MAG: DUF2934 domain-containing protein [Nitrospirota bacterium]
MAKGSKILEAVPGRDVNEEIAKIAYQLYEQRGKTHGYEFDDWIKAEKIVKERYAKIDESEGALAGELIEKRTKARKQTRKKA